MEYLRVRKTDLARNTSQIIRNVLRGQPTIIENHGQPEVAIVDVIDYLILRALAHFHAKLVHDAAILRSGVAVACG